MINEKDFQVDTFSGPDNKMYIKIDKVCDVNEVIRLRNFLDSEIKRIENIVLWKIYKPKNTV